MYFFSKGLPHFGQYSGPQQPSIGPNPHSQLYGECFVKIEISHVDVWFTFNLGILQEIDLTFLMIGQGCAQRQVSWWDLRDSTLLSENSC
jgi:hypothetical protein